MAFGGPITVGGLYLNYSYGERAGSLVGLHVRRGSGLGGRVWRDGTPGWVDEYSAASNISHDYDEQVAPEGLRSVVAVPVLNRSDVIGVIYAGMRDGGRCGDRLRDFVVTVGGALSLDLRIEAAVGRRTRAYQVEIAQLKQQIRGLRADVRTLRPHASHRRSQPIIAKRDEPMLSDGCARLTGRELDVITLVAEGLSYIEVAKRLCLSPQTVKSYMRDINRKLGATSRHEAVVRARAAGLLA